MHSPSIADGDTPHGQAVPLLRHLASAGFEGAFYAGRSEVTASRQKDEILYPATQGGDGRLPWPADLQTPPLPDGRLPPVFRRAAFLRRCNGLLEVELRDS